MGEWKRRKGKPNENGEKVVKGYDDDNNNYY